MPSAISMGSEVPRLYVDVDVDYSVITKNNPAVLSVVDDNDCAISMTDLVSVNSRKEQ